MIKYEICDNTKINEVVNFIEKIDKDFPIPVSGKVKIEEYVNKLNNNGKIIIALDDNNIIGICAGYMNDIEKYNAYVSILGVDYNYRKNGVAKELINSFIKEAYNCNMKNLFLETHKENIPALNFYKKNQFELLENIEANIKENVVLMKKIMK